MGDFNWSNTMRTCMSLKWTYVHACDLALPVTPQLHTVHGLKPGHRAVGMEFCLEVEKLLRNTPGLHAAPWCSA